MPIPFVHRHNVDFVLCGTVAWDAAVDCPSGLIIILWFGNSFIRVNLDSTSICISLRCETNNYISRRNDRGGWVGNVGDNGRCA